MGSIRVAALIFAAAILAGCSTAQPNLNQPRASQAQTSHSRCARAVVATHSTIKTTSLGNRQTACAKVASQQSRQGSLKLMALDTRTIGGALLH